MLRTVVIAGLAAGLIVFGWAASRPTSAGQQVYGDASCDGTVNSIDAAVLLQLSAGLLTSLNCPANANVNGDGAVNSLDAALILQFVAGLLPSLGPAATATPTAGTPQLCPDGYFWNPAKGHCDSRECPPGLVFDEELLYCVLAPPTGSTATPPPGGKGVAHEVFYYTPRFAWSDTHVDVAAGQMIDVVATGHVIYDNLYLDGVTADGDGLPTGWGPCPNHSMVGWAGDERPAFDAPVLMANVVCLGANFSGATPTGGNLYVAVNDRGSFDDDVGSWNVLVTTY